MTINDNMLMWMRKVGSAMVLDTAAPTVKRRFSISLEQWLKVRGIDPTAVTIEDIQTGQNVICFDVVSCPEACLVEVKQLRIEFPELPMNTLPSRDQVAKRLATAFPGLSIEGIKNCSPVGADGWAELDLIAPNIVMAPGSPADFLLMIDTLRGRSQAADPVAEARGEGEREILRMQALGASADELAALRRLHEQRAALVAEAMRPKHAEVIDLGAPLASLVKGLATTNGDMVKETVIKWLGQDPTQSIDLSSLLGLDPEDERSLTIALRIPIEGGMPLGVAIEGALIPLGYSPRTSIMRQWTRVVPEPVAARSVDLWWRREPMPKGVLRIEERDKDGSPVFFLPADASEAQVKATLALVTVNVPAGQVERETHLWGVRLEGRFVAQGFAEKSGAEAVLLKYKGGEVASYLPTGSERKS